MRRLRLLLADSVSGHDDPCRPDPYMRYYGTHRLLSVD